ncbi:MAG: VanZ protein [Actinomycetota bacterium]|nr:VanZ protein [Actinomycetota bacterium]
MLAVMNQLAAAASAWWLHLEKVLEHYGGWLLGVVVIAVLLAVPLARLLRSNPLVTGLLAMSLLSVVALSLAPSTTLQAAAGVCLRPVTLPVGRQILWPSDLTANVLMYLPLGVAVVWLRPTSVRLVAVVAALLVPPVIELTQKEVLVINRQCSLSDIIGNEVGLLVGMAVGSVLLLGWQAGRPSRPARPLGQRQPRHRSVSESARQEIPTRL